MQKRIFLAPLIASFMLTSVHAALKPVATLNLGVDFVDARMRQNITFIAPFQNTYAGHLHQTQFVGGLFLGAQTSLTPTIDVQAGFSYYHTNKFQTSGVIYQFADPSMDNLGYQYNIQSDRYYAEGKLLLTSHEYYHPFISVGLGQAKNKAFHFKESPLTTDAVPMDLTFKDHLANSFSYLVGVGIEGELTKHIRLGAAYRWVGLNQVRLGASPYQDSSGSLSNRLNANEFLVQLSYLG